MSLCPHASIIAILCSLPLVQRAVARLRMFHNAAVRGVTNTKSRQQITPMLASLRWLSVELRIEYKVRDEASEYISELFCSYSNLQSLRSANQCI